MVDPRNVRFNVNPDDIQLHVDQGDGDENGQNNQNNQNNNLNVQNAQNDGQGAQVNIPAGAPGAAQMTLAFKVEQSKIPKFYGQKGKDNITAIVYIRKIDDLAWTNRWNDTTTYASVAYTLNGGDAGLDWRSTHVDQPEAEISETSFLPV
jgi:hypothetical protein